MCKRVKEEFPIECAHIWRNIKYIKEIKRKDVEHLWEEFSAERYFAGFIIPYDSVIYEFIEWFEERCDK